MWTADKRPLGSKLELGLDQFGPVPDQFGPVPDQFGPSSGLGTQNTGQYGMSEDCWAKRCNFSKIPFWPVFRVPRPELGPNLV